MEIGYALGIVLGHSVLDIEITQWKMRAYGFYARVEKYQENEPVSAANE